MIGAFLLYLGIFSLIYSSVLSADYGYSDDYADVYDSLIGHNWSIHKKIGEGRALYALWTHFFLSVTTAIEDFYRVRFVGILNTALVASVLFGVLVRTGYDRIQSFFVGVIVGCSLPFQIYAAWHTTAIFPFASFVSYWAFSVTDRRLKTNRHLDKNHVIAGGTLLMIGLAIYQPASLYFWVFAAVVLLKPGRPFRDVFRCFGWFNVVVCVAMLLGYLLYRLGVYLVPDVTRRGDIVWDLFAKTEWFFSSVLPSALTFAWIFPFHCFLPQGDTPLPTDLHWTVKSVTAWLIAASLVPGLVLHLKGSIKATLCKCSIAVSLLPLSYLPNLVTASDGSLPTRTLPVTASLIVVYAFFGLRGYASYFSFFSDARIRMLVGGIAVASAVSTAYHVSVYLVAPQVQELALMRSRLAGKDLSQIQRIDVIRPRWRDSFAPLRIGDFGRPSSYDEWNSSAMVFLLWRKMDLKHPFPRVSSVHPTDDVFVPGPPPLHLIIDMRINH